MLLVSSSVLPGLRKSLNSSSHLFFGLPTALKVLYFVLRSMFYSAAFLTHLSSGRHAVLIANLHFILLCVPIQHVILAVSSAQWQQLCFFSRIQSILLLRCQLCQFLHLYHSWRRCRCLDRNLCLSCFHQQLRLRSFNGFLSRLLHLSLFSGFLTHTFTVSPFLSCVFFLYFFLSRQDKTKIRQCVHSCTQLVN